MINPLPLMVRVKAAPPIVAVAGARTVIAGEGLLTAKAAAVDVPPPGAGTNTVTGNEPVVTISVARIWAVICVALTKVVARGSPLKFTTESLVKFAPFTVTVNALPPTSAPEGEMVVSTGAGLLMVKVLAGDRIPPGFTTTTGTAPAVSISEARICAVSWLEFTNVVVRSRPLNRTTAPLTNPEPFTVSVKAGPAAVALEGDRLVMLAVTAKLIAAVDIPPLGFMTFTE